MTCWYTASASYTRARTLAITRQVRSGLQEDASVATRQRRLLDPLELHDWIDKSMAPLSDAWSRVWTHGTQSAIDRADELAEACAALLGTATSKGAGRGKVATFIMGETWSDEQHRSFEVALRLVSERRVAFALLMRQEMGAEVVTSALERARVAEEAVPNQVAEPARGP